MSVYNLRYISACRVFTIHCCTEQWLSWKLQSDLEYHSCSEVHASICQSFRTLKQAKDFILSYIHTLKEYISAAIVSLVLKIPALWLCLSIIFPTLEIQKRIPDQNWIEESKIILTVGKKVILKHSTHFGAYLTMEPWMAWLLAQFPSKHPW